jgi:excinuclease ABC subunit A
MLRGAAPQGQFLWNNQQLVHFMVPEQREPWATIQTKKPHALMLHLNGPKGRFALGRLLNLGSERALDDSRPDRDTIRLHFILEEHLHTGDIEEFLREHLKSLRKGD